VPRENLNAPIAISTLTRGEKRDVVLVACRPVVWIELEAGAPIDIAAIEQASGGGTQAGLECIANRS
jgi:hypothetical protein